MQDWHAAGPRSLPRRQARRRYLLAFGGTRTVHRLAAAIEDAGWEIRDMLVWGYASGFPKSHNLDGEWNGWGTALKPAWEPIVMARKPLRGTVAANVLRARHRRAQHRRDADRHRRRRTQRGSEQRAVPRRMEAGDACGRTGPDATVTRHADDGHVLGRWPANVILTDPIFDGGDRGRGGRGRAGGGRRARSAGATSDGCGDGFGATVGPSTDRGYGDSGTYSRFFLIPKSCAGRPGAGAGRAAD